VMEQKKSVVEFQGSAYSALAEVPMIAKTVSRWLTRGSMG